jgi:hypothetical protein
MKQGPSRGSLIFLSLAVLVLVIGFKFSKTTSAPPATPGTATQLAAERPEPRGARTAPAEDSELRALSPSQLTNAAPLPAIVQSANRPPPSSAPAPDRVPASQYASQLVANLTNIDFTHGPITSAQADQWKQSLQALTAQGAAAVPAIRDFLERNQDLNFGAIGGGDLMGQSSLRTALINGLQQIGGPEATALMLQTLQSTTVPSEIELLAKNLEQQAPGQYRQEALNAANDVLAMAGKGQLPGWDVGSLFKVLQNYGDAGAANTLAQLQSQWKYYSAMSLAALPNGQGVPSLINLTQNLTQNNDFTYQMIAQVAAQNPEAGNALLEKARLNQIPDSAWNKIASELAGEQYLVGQPPSGLPPGDVKQYHIESGNQNFYSLKNISGSQDQSIALIDRLLGVTSNPAAITALQGARATLSGAK